MQNCSKHLSKTLNLYVRRTIHGNWNIENPLYFTLFNPITNKLGHIFHYSFKLTRGHIEAFELELVSFMLAIGVSVVSELDLMR